MTAEMMVGTKLMVMPRRKRSFRPYISASRPETRRPPCDYISINAVFEETRLTIRKRDCMRKRPMEPAPPKRQDPLRDWVR